MQVADVGKRSRASSGVFPAALYMQNEGSKYLNPSNGPREHPVTNLIQFRWFPKEKFLTTSQNISMT
nr:hypothetical protein Iba_chr13eCG4240 [Ipomoea batatas]